MELFDLTNFEFTNLIDPKKPWESLDKIESYINDKRDNLLVNGYKLVGEAFIHETAIIDASAKIEGSAIIGPESEVRDNALLRKGVIIGKNCKIGHATEIKHSIILDHTSAGHFNYIGDSVVGNHVNFGAGAIVANLKSGSKNETIALDYFGEKTETGLKKLGGLIGDNVKIGSNSVLNPGSVIGKNTVTYPLTSIRGFIDENKIVKNNSSIEISDKQ
jgi:NDP-sugar pyrophosphorylase family protein